MEKLALDASVIVGQRAIEDRRLLGTVPPPAGPHDSGPANGHAKRHKRNSAVLVGLGDQIYHVS